jgi:Rps23 Pro-64 3,4-dihydroxylase Tpa1-like proline 4-hydroxylase
VTIFAEQERSDTAVLHSRYAADRSVSIPGFLTAVYADALTAELEASEEWLEIFRAGDKVYEMPQAAYAALDEGQKNALRVKIEDAARDALQYRYRAVRVSEDEGERARRGLLVDLFADLMNSPAMLQFLRSVTGRDDIVFADAQATDYRGGDFLTTHDDAIEGKDRVAAYVFSLTRRWQADWGGLLMFEDGERVSGFIPDFNALRLFSVPSKHHVSLVVPWAGERRLSITGWLRSSKPRG